MRRLLTPRGLLSAGALGFVIVFALAWALPSDSFLYEPNRAQSLNGKVTVEGAKPDKDGGDIYYVDITVRRASWIERLFSFMRPDGSTLVPEEQILPDGGTFEQRRESSRRQMERSEQVAAAVALDAAGLDVSATPRGALVAAVSPDVPAREVIEDGDVIVAVDGVRVGTPEDLRRQIGKLQPGDTAELVVRRKGKATELEVETVEAPGEPERAVIGVLVEQDADIQLPLDVEIDLGEVGGPSAGLAFGLDILEQLGFEVDQGRRIAATGELALDGTVVPIGGVKQKTLGAEATGVDVFVVPAGDNARDARRYARDMRVIPVETFQQALQKLATAVVST